MLRLETCQIIESKAMKQTALTSLPFSWDSSIYSERNISGRYIWSDNIFGFWVKTACNPNGRISLQHFPNTTSFTY